MSRVLLVPLTEDQVVAACAAENVSISTVERLQSGGVRLVCNSTDGAVRVAGKFKPHVIDGVVTRERRCPPTLLW